MAKKSTLTSKQLCDALEISIHTLRKYIKSGCPFTKPAKSRSNVFDIDKVREWMALNGVTGKVGRPYSIDLANIEDAKFHKESEMVRYYQMRNDQIAGTLVERSVVDAENAKKVVEVRSKLMGIGASIADRLAGKSALDVQKELDEYMSDICMEFAQKKNSIWTVIESQAWSPPEKITPSQWPEKHRILTSFESAMPGKWKNDRSPYLPFIMDAMERPEIEMVVVLKGTQVGYSELTRNMMGYWITNNPGPCLFVMPSEASAKEIAEERIKPLIRNTPVLKNYITGRTDDVKQNSIKLNTMSIYLAWSGSPQALASRPIRWLIFDEVDKYPPFTGREADPISLGLKRLSSYKHRARVLMGSTPTDRQGPIWRYWESCGVQYNFCFPCCVCGKYQMIRWENVKWPKRPDGQEKNSFADDVELGSLARYECEHCHTKMSEIQKQLSFSKCKPIQDGATLHDNGNITGTENKSKRIGFRIPTLLSPTVPLSKLAAEWIRADGEIGLTMDFRNSRLAEPFEDTMSKLGKNVIRERSLKSPMPGIVPIWCGCLVATIDTQKDHFYYTIRAWGHGYRSQLIDYGRCENFDELKKKCVDVTFPVDQTNIRYCPNIVLIDSGGGRQDEIYQFTGYAPERMFAIKGGSKHTAKPWTLSKISNYGNPLRILNVGFFKDMVSRLIMQYDGDTWLVHNEVKDDYCSQMCSEQKILDRKRMVTVWAKITSSTPNHYWDCEVYQTAAAYMFDVVDIPEGYRIVEQHKLVEKNNTQRAERRRERSSGGWEILPRKY